MVTEGTATVAGSDISEFKAVLAELDRTAAVSDARWGNKRDAVRTRARIPCTVRYVAIDGKSMGSIEGCVRDISSSGIGFVTRQHFVRGAPIFLSLRPPGSKVRNVTAKVVYSRLVREYWYLCGAKFEALADSKLAKNFEEQAAQVVPTEPSTEKQPISGSQSEEATPSRRERALRLLSAAANTGVSSKETINKIVLLSGSDDHSVRRASIPALLQITSPEGRLGLEGFLQDPNPQIQVEAAEALACIDATGSIRQIKELLKHEEADVALRVASALGRLNDRSGLAVVRRYLFGKGPHTRAAVRTLGIIVGRKFRLNEAGLADARKYMKTLGK